MPNLLKTVYPRNEVTLLQLRHFARTVDDLLVHWTCRNYLPKKPDLRDLLDLRNLQKAEAH